LIPIKYICLYSWLICTSTESKNEDKRIDSNRFTKRRSINNNYIVAEHMRRQTAMRENIPMVAPRGRL